MFVKNAVNHCTGFHTLLLTYQKNCRINLHTAKHKR